MTKTIRFYTPDDPQENDLDVDIVCDMLALVNQPVVETIIHGWTQVERIIAYDWAVRIHMHASDSKNIHRRNQPRFVRAAVTFTEELMKENKLPTLRAEIFVDENKLPTFDHGERREHE